MHKFFTQDITEMTARITGDDVKHAWKVLRLKEGDRVLVNDLDGQDYQGEIRSINKTEVVVSLDEKIAQTNESPLELTIFQGLPKGQKMELVCQKLTELGAVRLVPLITQRVIPEVRSEYKKLDRLRRITLEAGKQSMRSRIMKVAEPIELTELEQEMLGLDLILVPYENQEGTGLAGCEDEIRASRRIGIVVGPEGGFESSEIQWLQENGARIITLGPRILRTETCALSVVSILQYIAGDMAGVRPAKEELHESRV